MAAKIVIELDVEAEEALVGVSDQQLGILLRDAFGEFADRRSPAREYVDRRYPGDGVFAGEARDVKVKQVERRINLANALHRGHARVEYDGN